MPTHDEEFLLPPVGDEPATGKTLSALHKSRQGHNALLALFGPDMFPSSIMRTKRVRSNATKDQHADERNYANCGSEWKRSLVDNEQLPNGVRGMARMLDYRMGDGTGALSKFPQDVGRSVVLFYTEPGDLVVDPFAGHNSRMELCVRAGRDYIGCDLSAEFMAFNRKRADELRAEFKNRKIKLYETDSRDQPIADGVGDFTITSPPYWDIEYYGPEQDQLGLATTYPQFMAELEKCMAENYRTLKPGAFSCWFINDFRRKASRGQGGFYMYHADLWETGQAVGFIGWDIIIVDLERGLRDGFPNEAIRTKVIPKRHEYCVVFRKPGGPSPIDDAATT